MRDGTNRFGEMAIFVAAIDHGSFSAAGRSERMTPSAVSKAISRLEERLGVRLVNRTTRALQLTAEGALYYDRALGILAELDEVERLAAKGDQPAGRVRINTSASFGNHILAPLVSQFQRRFPAINLVIVQTDSVIDLLGERTDIAIRSGPLKDSALLVRKLGTTPMRIVGSPAYLDRFGTPATIAELKAHNRLGFCYARAMDGWPLWEAGRRTTVPPSGQIEASDGEALRHLALAGVGLARLAAYTTRDDIACGRLRPVLEPFTQTDSEDVHAVHVGQGGHLPTRVRLTLDFLAETARVF